MENEIVNFTVRMPRYLVEAIDSEAIKEDRNRNTQIIRAFKERYGFAVDETEANAA